MNSAVNKIRKVVSKKGGRQPLGKVRIGFTLIELLVVISIIALLLSILMPSLSIAKESARAMVCRSNVKTMGLASFLYSDSNEDIIVPHEGGSMPGTDGQSFPWMALLLPYIDAESYDYSAQFSTHGNIDIFRCPSQKDEFVFHNRGTLFGINVRYTTHVKWNTGKFSKVMKSTKIKSPYSLMFIADTQDLNRRDAEFEKELEDYYNDPKALTTWLMASMYHGADTVAYRHKGKSSNLLFMDGHVDQMDLVDIRPSSSDSRDELEKKRRLWGEPRGG